MLLRQPTWKPAASDVLETCQECCTFCAELWRQPVSFSRHSKRRIYCLISLGKPLVWKGVKIKHKWADDFGARFLIHTFKLAFQHMLQSEMLF